MVFDIQADPKIGYRTIDVDLPPLEGRASLLLTIDSALSIERAMQLIKGGFAFRAGKEIGLRAPVWQKGFSEVRINDRQSFLSHKDYIWQNPVRAGLARVPEEYPFCSAYLRKQKAAAAKVGSNKDFSAQLKVVP